MRLHWFPPGSPASFLIHSHWGSWQLYIVSSCGWLVGFPQDWWQHASPVWYWTINAVATRPNPKRIFARVKDGCCSYRLSFGPNVTCLALVTCSPLQTFHSRGSSVTRQSWIPLKTNRETEVKNKVQLMRLFSFITSTMCVSTFSPGGPLSPGGPGGPTSPLGPGRPTKPSVPAEPLWPWP